MLASSSPKDQSFWDRWRGPRIVATTASELVDEGPVPLECYGRGSDARTDRLREIDRSHDRMQIALAARWNDAIVGGAILEIRGHTATIRTLHVDPAWRGRDVGQRLLRGLLHRARFQLVRDVRVLATAANAGFYALHGFRPADEQSPTAPDAASGDAPLLMQRRLSLRLVNTPIDGIAVKM